MAKKYEYKIVKGEMSPSSKFEGYDDFENKLNYHGLWGWKIIDFRLLPSEESKGDWLEYTILMMKEK